MHVRLDKGQDQVVSEVGVQSGEDGQVTMLPNANRVHQTVGETGRGGERKGRPEDSAFPKLETAFGTPFSHGWCTNR